MERYRKKDMLRAVDTLLNANDAIVKTARSNPQGVAEALVQCQESAIALGTYIDTLDEKYEYLVHMLEDYCENIYQMCESQSDENKCRKISKKIRKQLIELQDGIKYDLPEDKKEIVFLPYKASMWDSLESVWKAADANPDCNAYVIPIPYFDKNPDGSFREEHYEGDQYPQNVPITRYDEYDLEERHPDVIYIHNPYDECNHVTSVHPYFYCKNLRNYTDKLVYIPYFVLREIEPHNQSAVDDMKHFCFLPGTIYADQVIVQSENMRQIYINEYIKAAKEMGLGGEHVDRKFLEKKFLGTGSPKFEKILNTKKEDLEIPAEWLRIIEKPDGSRKKIVFYNISVSALLHDEEKLLRKMESVFELFKENQDKVALLWRPHPLIQSTIESMRPQLWEAYKEIRDKYIEEGWGIYDDSADLDRAVVLSDAYYGSGSSSVVQLYQKTGKPMMVQDVNVLLCNYTGFPCAIDGTWQEDDNIWFVGNEDNVLWHMNIITGTIQYVTVLASKSMEDTFRMSEHCIKAENYIFCLPDRADEILIYNIVSKQMESCKIDTNEKRIGIYNSWKYKGKIWCVSYFMQEIIEIDIIQKKIQGMYSVFKDKETLIGYEAVMQGEHIYCVSRNTTKVCRFDTVTKKKEYFDLQVDDVGFNTIAVDESGFYLTGYRKAIYYWNEKNNDIVVLENFPIEYVVLNEKETVENKYYNVPIFFNSLAMESYIVFLPWNFSKAFSNGIVVYKKTKKNFEWIEGSSDKDEHYFFCYKKLNDVVGIYCSPRNYILEVNRDSEVKYLEKFDTLGGEKAFAERSNVINERGVYSLGTLLLSMEEYERDEKRRNT